MNDNKLIGSCAGGFGALAMFCALYFSGYIRNNVERNVNFLVERAKVKSQATLKVGYAPELNGEHVIVAYGFPSEDLTQPENAYKVVLIKDLDAYNSFVKITRHLNR